MNRPTSPFVQTGSFEIPHVQHWLSSSLPRNSGNATWVFTQFFPYLFLPWSVLEIAWKKYPWEKSVHEEIAVLKTQFVQLKCLAPTGRYKNVNRSSWENRILFVGSDDLLINIYFTRQKKRRTQKMLTFLTDRGQPSAMPASRRCVAPWSQGTPLPSPWPASAGSTQMRSLSLVERTPRWVTSCHYMFICHMSLMSARRVPV